MNVTSQWGAAGMGCVEGREEGRRESGEKEGRMKEGRKEGRGEEWIPRSDPMWRISNRPTMASRRFGMKSDEEA